MAEREVQNVEESKVHVFSSSTELIGKLDENWNAVGHQPYPAMYSSIFGGVVLNPAMMMIPIDDHMVHRGHGVFDTTILFNGYLYDLDAHLDRFLRSASLAKISLPYPRSTLRSILLQLAAVSKCQKGELRYWLSAGPGDFHLSSSGCSKSAFYAIVIKEDFSQWKDGVRAVTSSVPMKTPLFATIKNVNYLPNVLSQMEAEEKGAFASIWVDDNGYVAEGPNMNVALINHDRELIMPPFDNILTGCTAVRLLELAPRLVEEGRLKDVKTANVSVEEAKSAAEMMFVGSGLPIAPIVMWDEKPIGNGNSVHISSHPPPPCVPKFIILRHCWFHRKQPLQTLIAGMRLLIYILRLTLACILV
uniref:Aminodeoxychorismate lyase n=1 Tax=Opuntia streptacantha TaxID=393608 RepID=A0A7C8YR32_OPUST